jgi:hypothetical protein
LRRSARDEAIALRTKDITRSPSAACFEKSGWRLVADRFEHRKMVARVWLDVFLLAMRPRVAQLVDTAVLNSSVSTAPTACVKCDGMLGR